MRSKLAFLLFCCFEVGVHPRWLVFVREQRTWVGCDKWGVMERLCQRVIPALILSASALCFVMATLCGLDAQYKSMVLKDPSQGKPGIRLGTFLCLSPLERHLIFSCHCCHTVTRSPLVIYWAEGRRHIHGVRQDGEAFCLQLSGLLSEAWHGGGHRVLKSMPSSLPVSDCDRFQNLGFRFSAHIAVFVTFGCIFKTSFAT